MSHVCEEEANNEFIFRGESTGKIPIFGKLHKYFFSTDWFNPRLSEKYFGRKRIEFCPIVFEKRFNRAAYLHIVYSLKRLDVYFDQPRL
jgi:hypothetical protein